MIRVALHVALVVMATLTSHASAADQEPKTIRVFRAATDFPAEGARVLLYDELPGGESPPPDNADPARLLEWMMPRSQTITTGPHGNADLPRVRGTPSVLVCIGEDCWWFRRANLDSSSGLYLSPKSGWRARVTDSRGNPVVGVRVRLSGDINYNTCFGYGGYETVADAVTDDAGFATLPAQRWLDPDRAMYSRFSSPSHFAIRPIIRGPVQPWHLTDWEDQDFGDVQLRVPDTGSLIFRLWDAERKPFEGDAYVGLEGAGGGSWSAQWKPGEPHEGVAIGQGLVVTAKTSYDGLRSDPVSVRGPRFAGEVVRVDLQLRLQDPVIPRITARFLDPSGSVLADQRVGVSWSVRRETKQLRDSSVLTDNEGRATFRGRGAADPLVLDFIGRTRSSPYTTRLVGRAVVPGGIFDRDTDLGDIVLTEIPTLVAGRVMDWNGDPLSGAKIVCWRTDADRPDTARHHTETSETQQAARSDAAGRFHIRFDSADIPWQLECVDSNHDEIRFRPGQDDLQVDIRSIEDLCFLRTRWLMDTDVPRELLDLSFHLAARPGRWQTWPRFGAPGPTDTALNPGEYIPRITCRRRGVNLYHWYEDHSPTELDLPPIRIEPGQLDKDLTIDLRGRLTFFRLQVVDEEGGYRPGVTCRIHRTGDHRLLQEITTNAVGRIRYLGIRGDYRYELWTRIGEYLGGGRVGGSLRHIIE